MVRNRRAFLAGVGSVAVAGLAGCSGSTDSGEQSATETAASSESPTATESATETTAGTETVTSNESSDVEGEVRGSSTPLEITDQNYFERASVVGVTGTVENTGDSTYSIVTVHMSPFEDQEERGKFYATTASQNVDQLAPGETWNFVVAFGESEVTEFNRYEVWVTGKKQE